MSRPLRIVALDLSTASTAIAQTHKSTGEAWLSVQTVPDTEGRPLHVQIDRIEMAVRQACGRGSGNVWLGPGQAHLVVIEGTFSRPGGSDYPLHALHGNVKQWLYRCGIAYADVAPASLKVWATGSGATRGVNKVTKAKVRPAIVATYGRFLHINPNDDDACDAVGLLTMGLAAYGQALADVDPKHARALEAVTWPEIGGH